MTASRFACAGLLAVFLGAFGSASAAPPRPAPGSALYNGRPLSEWAADLKDPDVLVREEAIEVLGQAGAAARAAVPLLEKMLGEAPASTRVRIVLALWHIDGRKKEAVKILAECLNEDEGPISRVQALAYLGQLGADAAPAMDAILGLLDTTDYALRAQVNSTLQQLGDLIAPAIVKALGSSKSTLRHNALLYLTQHFGPPLPGTVAALTPLLKDADKQVQAGAATLLWRNGRHTEVVAGVLVEGMRSPDQTTRYQIVNAVYPGPGTPVPKAALPVLKAGLAATDPYVRLRSAQGVWTLEQKVADVLPIYLKALEDNNYTTWSQAAAGIAQIGPAARAALPALTKRLQANVRGGYLTPEIFNACVAIGPDAIDPLVDVLKTPGMNANMRQQAAYALGRMGPKATPTLVRLLDSTDSVVRNGVSHALGKMGSEAKEAVPALAKLLADKDLNVRLTTARSLGLIGPAARAAVEPLGKLIRDTDPRIRAAALAALGQIAREPKVLLPQALAAMDDRDPGVQLGGLELLARADPSHPKLQATLLALLEKSSVKTQVLSLLPRLGSAGAAAVPALVDLLNDKKYLTLRYQIVHTLGQMGPAAREAVPALADLLKDSNRQIRSNALLALQNLGPAAREAVPALIHVLKDPDLNLRHQAISAISNIGPAARRAVPDLIPFLKEGNINNRRMAVVALGRIGTAAHAALPDVLALVENADTSLQSSVLVTLQQIRGPADGKQIAEKVTALLEKKKVNSFWIVAPLLGDLGRDAAAAVPFLLAEAKKPTSTYRLPAAEAVARIDPERARKELVPMLQEQLRSSPSPLPLAAALDRIDPGNKEALAAFRAMLTDKAVGNRAFAAQLLGMRGPDAKWALPALRKALTDEAAPVRMAAAGAVWNIGKDARAVLPVLLKELKEAEPAYLRGTAAFRLGDMGAEAKSAIPALLEAWRSGDVNLRFSALNALNRIDPDAVTGASARKSQPPKPTSEQTP